jgi:hypothetical protein
VDEQKEISEFEKLDDGAVHRNRLAAAIAKHVVVQVAKKNWCIFCTTSAEEKWGQRLRAQACVGATHIAQHGTLPNIAPEVQLVGAPAQVERRRIRFLARSGGPTDGCRKCLQEEGIRIHSKTCTVRQQEFDREERADGHPEAGNTSGYGRRPQSR